MTKQEFLAMSLPYGLMFKNLNENTNEQLSGVDTYLVANWSLPLYPNGTICVYSSIDHSSIWSINEVKPIIHPLSDLTKEIEHKGEKFVPMVELAKIEGTYDDNDEEYVEANYKGFVISTGIMEFIYNHNDKSFHLSIGMQSIGVKNQLLLFQKLIEWHFDIADLISKGEAIDVNTLEINPYK